MTDLISKKSLIEAINNSLKENDGRCDVIDLINSAPMVKSIEHGSPSAPTNLKIRRSEL